MWTHEDPTEFNIYLSFDEFSYPLIITKGNKLSLLNTQYHKYRTAILDNERHLYQYGIL